MTGQGNQPDRPSPADGCSIEAHYQRIQAICDALGHAAQLEMADAIELEQSARLAASQATQPPGDSEAIVDYLAKADQHVLERERAYGKWLGVKGVLRAFEGATYDFTPREHEMWALIDWGRETFNFPGKEAFPSLADQVQPGSGR